MKRILNIIIIILLSAICLTGTAQKIAVKSNLLGWATATPTLGMEAYPRTTRSALLALSKVQRAFLRASCIIHPFQRRTSSASFRNFSRC